MSILQAHQQVHLDPVLCWRGGYFEAQQYTGSAFIALRGQDTAINAQALRIPVDRQRSVKFIKGQWLRENRGEIQGGVLTVDGYQPLSR